MRILFVLICSLALACVALGEEQGTKKEEKPKKKGAQAGQVSEPTGKAAGKPTGAGKPAEVGKATGAGKAVAAGGAAGTKVKPQHFKLANKPKPEVAPAVTFQQNRHIEGSQNWQGSNYTVFRNYSSEWHDQGWWRQRYNRIVVFGGGACY